MIRGLYLRRVCVVLFVYASLLLLMSGASALEAKAGDSQTVWSDASVTLDGSGSIGTNLTYKWTENDTTLSTHKVVSRKFSIGTHTITLMVSNSTSDDIATVIVTVKNRPPIADAGDDRVILPDTDIKLDAAGSSDPDGKIKSYRWTEYGVELSTRESFNKIFDAGRHEITLVVTDDFGDTGEDTLEILVNCAPIADAGPDRTLPEGTLVHFNASNSSDSDGNTLYYEWKEDGGSILNLAQSFDMVLPIGTHHITLTLTDGYGATAIDRVTIEVTAVDQKPPIADAGSDQTVLVGTAVMLDASGSTDPDGEISKYEWLEGSIVLNESMAFDHIFPKGVHHITLVVTDNDGASGTDDIMITARSSMDIPEADAGADREAREGAEIILDASRSSGENLTYQWILNGTTISEAQTFYYIFDPGTYTVTLSVTDEYGCTDTDEVSVVVTTPAVGPGTSHLPVIPEVSRTRGLWSYILVALLILILAGIVFMRRRSATTRSTGTAYGYKYKEYTPPPDKTGSKTGKTGKTGKIGKPASKPASKSNAKPNTGIAPPGPKPVPVQQKVMMKVTVLDSTSRTPIPGAMVQTGSITMKTDTAGEAMFALDRGGQHTVSVSSIPNLYEGRTASVEGDKETILLSSTVRPDQEQDAKLRSVRGAFENRYREVSGYDRCIPNFYRSVAQRLIEYVRGMTAIQFIGGKAGSKEVTDQMIPVIESVCTELSEIMVSKRNIDLYARSTTGNENSQGCNASQINYDQLPDLVASPSGFVSATSPKVEQTLLEIDREITSRTRNMSVIPITGVWSIAKSLLADQSGGDLECAIRILIADTLLRYAKEMYESPEIVERLKQGIL
ncbi:MAG: PKD domain-containing protein [Euryarchaeota archaeon]|nr:PKD domain-containing protein [Euryarchaeota archaeon]